jgi:hypothetical protein
MCALVCVRYAHVCTTRTILNRFSPKLVETFLGSQKRAQHNRFLGAHLSMGARTCVHVLGACTCAHVLGARTCTHVRVHTFLDVLAPQLLKTSLCVCYMLFKCTLACTMCVHPLHACARSHILGRMLSKLGATFYGSQRVAWATLFLRACLRVHTLRVDALKPSVLT